MSHTLTIRLDKDLAGWLEREARESGVSQGKIVRDQLERAKASGTSKPFMRLAGAVRGGARTLSTRKGFSRT
jgi:ribbon-helix-helix CopG family protein